VFVTLLSTGCARIPSGVNLVSTKDKHAFAEKYPAAYISRGSGGDYHVILLKDGVSDSSPAKPGAPIRPLALADVRQVLHIHIFWAPMRGAKPDNPSATNAAIDWYLVRAGADGAVTGLAHYEGAGLVTASIADDAAGIIVRSGNLTPKTVAGDITDPIGPSRITARFDAVHKDSAVTDILAQLDHLQQPGLPADSLDAARLTEPAASARN